MNGAGSVYGEALYSLAREESLTAQILQELTVLQESFAQEPDFLRLLDSHNLPKAQRCALLEQCFRDKIHGYTQNFLKILVERGHIRQFPACVETFRNLYYEDNQILQVRATTAVALSQKQSDRLCEKLSALTGKQILLTNRVDPAVLGGICLDYDGKRLDDSVAHRLEEIRSMLVNMVL